MNKFLNDIRSAENPISGNKKIINTIAILFLGVALGTFSKVLDFCQAELPSVLMAIDGTLDVHNFLGRFAIWVLIALCISIYSNSSIRARVNVFLRFYLIWLCHSILDKQLVISVMNIILFTGYEIVRFTMKMNYHWKTQRLRQGHITGFKGMSQKFLVHL